MATEKQNFVDKQLRRVAELLEQLDVVTTTLSTDWDSGLSAQFANNSTPYDDGRAPEGLDQFNEALVHTAVNAAISLQTDRIVPIRAGLRTLAVRLPYEG